MLLKDTETKTYDIVCRIGKQGTVACYSPASSLSIGAVSNNTKAVKLRQLENKESCEAKGNIAII